MASQVPFAVFDTEEFCDLWLLSTCRRQPKTFQALQFLPLPHLWHIPTGWNTCPAILQIPCSLRHCVHQGSQLRNVWVSAAVQLLLQKGRCMKIPRPERVQA